MGKLDEVWRHHLTACLGSIVGRTRRSVGACPSSADSVIGTLLEHLTALGLVGHAADVLQHVLPGAVQLKPLIPVESRTRVDRAGALHGGVFVLQQ